MIVINESIIEKLYFFSIPFWNRKHLKKNCLRSFVSVKIDKAKRGKQSCTFKII